MHLKLVEFDINEATRCNWSGNKLNLKNGNFVAIQMMLKLGE